MSLRRSKRQIRFNILSSGCTMSIGPPSSPGVTTHGTTWPMTRPRSFVQRNRCLTNVLEHRLSLLVECIG
jgi:hypothetical protein